MPRRKAPEDMSVEELRRLLIEKRRGARRERLEHFKRTGRVVDVAPDILASSAPVVDTLEEISDQPQVLGMKRGRVMDRILLVVEVLAVVGLVGVLISGFGVLPSGHIPPDAQGNTRPNDAEIPAHLQPMVQSLANIPIPTAAPDQAIRIQIPAIKIDAPVVQGDGWEQLKKGVGQNVGSANPGQNGNVILSAHDDVYGELFRFLDKLQPGDQIILYSQQRQFVYVVDRTAIVEPTAVEVMASTGSPTVTLISCYPYLVDKQRIVVFARLQN